MDKRTDMLPQYMRIAADIAAKIVASEYAIDQKIPGKSTLSSAYGVSQETVRKAENLLSDMGVVRIKENCGTVVVSTESAKSYLETIKIREEQVGLREQLRSMFSDYNDLGKKILEISENIISSASIPLPADQSLPMYEITVPDISDKANMSIGDLRFWQCTGATIVAIKRGQCINVSPGPYAVLRAGDIVVYTGPSNSRRAVQQLFTSGRTQNTLYLIQEQINTAVHMKELSIVADTLGARLGDISDFVAMDKGMTNHSYLFSCKGNRYILRIPGEGTVNLINRTHEEKVYRAIAGIGLCDDVVYMNPQNGLKVTRFLDGVRTCDPYNDSDVRNCIAMLRRFHGISLKVEHSFDIFGNIEYYESLWKGHPSTHENYAQTKADIMSLKAFVEENRAEYCLTHIDAVPDNFLFHPVNGTEQLQLTDWEYAGMQDPHVDIAMFCLYSLYDQPHIDHLIDLYFDGNCDERTRIKVYCYIAACGLLWSNWSEYKRILGVEFGDYGEYQYAYAEKYYEIARKEMEKL